MPRKDPKGERTPPRKSPEFMRLFNYVREATAHLPADETKYYYFQPGNELVPVAIAARGVCEYCGEAPVRLLRRGEDFRVACGDCEIPPGVVGGVIS